jgi:5-(carboxyamino)imidazole ribonucleotide synthase
MKIRKAPIGILGDGQLALMLGEAASAQGIDFLGFGLDAHSSFAARFREQFVLGDTNNQTQLNEFARSCSALTLENEFIPFEILEKVKNETATPVVPSPESYQFFAGKISQRQFYEKHGISGPNWAILASATNCPLPFPVVVKASEGGYDGYGVRIARNEEEFTAAAKQFGIEQGKRVLVEEKVAIAKELAQGILLDGKGNYILLPLVETVQRNGICEMVLSRPTLSESKLISATQEIQTILMKIARSGLNGLFNFEFFLTAEGRVLMNEGAPRPHNSQHLTIDASPVSQFSLLMNFLATGELDSKYKNAKALPSQPAVMINLLGQSKGENYSLQLPSLPDGVVAHPKLYLKKECRPGRKMGHLNLVDPQAKINLIELADRVLKEYQL